ncbi:MAG: DUF1800 domain-containing protein [Actinomycetota bacterium]
MVTARERIAHVFRRLSMGVHPDLARHTDTVDDAIARALDVSATPAIAPTMPQPADEDAARDYSRLAEPVGWWYAQMIGSPRLIEERLVWFWTDHFATGIQKVRSPDLMWRQHLTIRQLATGSFADLLRAIATNGAMLVYLDGIQNSVERTNENYAREVMELHTLGRGSYTQADVVAAARAFTGWVVNQPFRPRTQRFGSPFESYFAPNRHDAGEKMLLGVTGALDLNGAIDVLLDQPASARFIGAKLYRALVGVEPDEQSVDRIAAAFRRDWSILALVERIVRDAAFVEDSAVRTIVRTPIEKLVGLAQAVGAPSVDVATTSAVLRSLGFSPFAPPNPAGYARGRALLGPHQLVHTFDLIDAAGGEVDVDANETLARFGVYDATDATLGALAAASTARGRTLLALGSPEFALR